MGQYLRDLHATAELTPAIATPAFNHPTRHPKKNNQMQLRPVKPMLTMTTEEKMLELRHLVPSMVQHGDYWTALCPAHKDTNPSLSITPTEAGILLNCHAGCEFHNIAHGIGKPGSWFFPANTKYRSKSEPEYTKGESLPGWGEPKAIYSYLDEHGVELYQSCRFERWNKDTDATEKKFRQRRQSSDGKWVYSLQNSRRILYRLPELIASDRLEPVYIVEGEKCVDLIRSWGLIATCNPMGAGKWLAAYNKFLKDRHVIILPDNDEPGEKHLAKVASSLKGIASSIRVVRLPDLPPKGDVVDWAEAGGTGQGLVELAKVQPDSATVTNSQVNEIYSKAAERAKHSDEDEILDALGIVVMGECEDDSIEVWCLNHKKLTRIKNINWITVPTLLQMCGTAAKTVIWRGDGQSTPDPGTYRLSQIKEAIAFKAGAMSVSDKVRLGIGIWECTEDDEDADDEADEPDGESDTDDDDDTDDEPAAINEGHAIILVNSKSATIVNGKPEPYIHNNPIFGSAMLDLSHPDPWFDHSEMTPLIMAARDPAWRREVFTEAHDLYRRWEYHSVDEEIMPHMLVGLILGTLVQSFWTWRPLVSVIGRSSSGKSTFFRTLAGNTSLGMHGMFGSLSLSSSDVTSAGITQQMQNKGMLLLLDEFEKSRNRDEILLLLRGSGSGGAKIRGSSSQKARVYGLRHIVWTGATENGLRDEADKNRWIQIEFKKPSRDNQGKLLIPSDTALRTLGRKMIAVAIASVYEARKMATAMETRIRTTDIRIVQSYSVPASMAAVACGLGPDECEKNLLRMIETYTASADTTSDEWRLMESIGNWIIENDTHGREKQTVSMFLERRHDHDAITTLAKHGIHVFTRDQWGGKKNWCEPSDCGVFLSTTALQQNLLWKLKDWERVNITQLLRRIPGSKECRTRVTGIQASGVLIPYEQFVNKEDWSAKPIPTSSDTDELLDF